MKYWFKEKRGEGERNENGTDDNDDNNIEKKNMFERLLNV